MSKAAALLEQLLSDLLMEAGATVPKMKKAAPGLKKGTQVLSFILLKSYSEFVTALIIVN
jgi:hypothetical protein